TGLRAGPPRGIFSPASKIAYSARRRRNRHPADVGIALVKPCLEAAQDDAPDLRSATSSAPASTSSPTARCAARTIRPRSDGRIPTPAYAAESHTVAVPHRWPGTHAHNEMIV